MCTVGKYLATCAKLIISEGDNRNNSAKCSDRTTVSSKVYIFKTLYLFVSEVFQNGFYSGAPGGAAARGASWVRKYGNPSMREILVKASRMARGRVHLRPTAFGLRFPR